MDIRRYEELGSTNDECARLAMAGAPSGTAVVARRQTGGRGRLSRPWLSLDGDNLFVSVLHHTRLPVDRVSGLTLEIGLAIAEALDEVPGLSGAVRLKWPNDMHLDGRKLGGILCELVEVEGGRAVIVGVGVNVGARSLPEPIAASATSLALAMDVPPSLAQVEALVVGAVGEALARYELAGRPDVDRWLLRASRVGAVGGRVREVASGRSATVKGIASDGALLLIWDGAERPEPFIAGELVAIPDGDGGG
ncbi:MAG TPA: biotin--[acetyl-CoA-carboxylase] ligase [Myxococcota bacterium]|nr:biotin--[acetyl-CoA-carboxylase] ligase [Myxococcota bacterium]